MPVEMWGLASGVVNAGMQAAVSSGTYTSASAWGPADTPPADWPADDLGPNRVRTEFTVAQGKTGPFSSGGDPSTRLWHRVAMGVTLT